MGINMKYIKVFIILSILSFTVSCGQQKRFIQYKVKEGETMSKIAQKLNMPKDKLVRLNPDVIGDPKKNTFIVVPEDKLKDYKNKTSKEVQIDKDSTLIKEIDSNRSQDSFSNPRFKFKFLLLSC